MKCSKCGEEWTAPPGKSLKFCPNCANPMPVPAVNSPDNVIKALVMQHSLKEGLFLNPSILSSLAADKLQNNDPEAVERIELAIYKKVPQELYALKNADEHKRIIGMNVILSSLIKTYNKETSYEIVNMFADALGFKTLVMAKSDNDSNQPYRPQQEEPNNPRTRIKTSELTIGSPFKFGGHDWIIRGLDDGKALLLYEKIWDKRPYHRPGGVITWENCTLRKELHDEFYNQIPQADRSRIDKSPLANNKNLWYGTDGGKDTQDYVFLLSIEEADQFFGNSGDYQNKRRKKYDNGKHIADSEGYYMSNNHDGLRVAEHSGTASWWWLRSPGGVSFDAACVGTAGGVYVVGGFGGVSAAGGGVRPALWLNL